jgi:hypothetical protein
METVQNANPTILNLSDLPTRKPTTSTRPRSALASLTPSYAHDPFSSSALPELITDDSSDDDDSVVERIDAQEIYGTLPSPAPPNPANNQQT